MSWVFLNPFLGEPVLCTPESCCCRHFCGFRDFPLIEHSTPLFVAVWIVFVAFMIPVVFVKATRLQIIGWWQAIGLEIPDLIVGRRPGAFSCQGSGVSLRI